MNTASAISYAYRDREVVILNHGRPEGVLCLLANTKTDADGDMLADALNDSLPRFVVGEDGRTLIPNLTGFVLSMKREIIADVHAGTLPDNTKTILSFGELHDHVDANCYGGFCDDETADYLRDFFRVEGEDPDNMPMAFMEFMNACQDGVNDWLENAGLYESLKAEELKLPKLVARKAMFCLGDVVGDDAISGFTFDERWNGSACPYFEKAEAERVANLYNQYSAHDGSDWVVTYDAERDAFVETAEGEQTLYHAMKIQTEDGERTVYPVGAHGWTWVEADAEVKS